MWIKGFGSVNVMIDTAPAVPLVFSVKYEVDCRLRHESKVVTSFIQSASLPAFFTDPEQQQHFVVGKLNSASSFRAPGSVNSCGNRRQTCSAAETVCKSPRAIAE